MKKYLYSVIASFFLASYAGFGQNFLITGRMSQAGEDGINVYKYDSSTGKPDLISKANAGPNPSYLCFSPKKNLIYAANEVNTMNGKRGGGISTLTYSSDFLKINKLNEISVPNGSPCFVSVSPEDDFLFTANYGGSSITVIRLGKDGIPERITDSITFAPADRKVSHPHMISFDPSGRRLYLTDLGLDRIMIYTLDRINGKLTSLYEKGISLPAGTGPRHFVFNKAGTRMYVIGELKSTVSVFEVNEKEGLVLLQTLPSCDEGYKGKNSAADLHLDDGERFLYGTNRGENSVVTYEIVKDGLLKVKGHSDCGGDWPRNFTPDPSGKYLLIGNQKSGNISVLPIEKKSGVPGKSILEVPLPAVVCLKFFNK